MRLMSSLCDFTDTSTDFDGSVVGWSWDFGDSSGTSSAQNPMYTYPGPGTYTVTLTVTDDMGGIGMTSDDVTVDSTVLAALQVPEARSSAPPAPVGRAGLGGQRREIRSGRQPRKTQ